MATLSLTIDTRRKKASKFLPIAYRLLHNQGNTYIITGVSVKLSDWDKGRRRVKASAHEYINDVHELNMALKEKLLMLENSLHKIEKEHGKDKIKRLSVSEVKKLLLQDRSSFNTLREFTNRLMNEMIKAGNTGNARIHKDSLAFFSKCNSNMDLLFTDINYTFLVKCENLYMQKNHSLAGFNVYVRTLRAIFNKAIKSGVASQDIYPFKTYTIPKQGKTKKRAVPKDVIHLIENYQAKPDSGRELAKNIFLFSFYCQKCRKNPH